MDEPCELCGRALLGSQEQAARSIVVDAEESGSLTDDRVAQARMLVGLAAAVDANPDRGALWREYRIAEAAFRASAAGSNDEMARLMAALSGDEP